MFRAEGGGLPVVLAPLTKPEQPLSTAGASATTKSSTPRCKRPLMLRRDSRKHPRFTIASSKTAKTRPEQTIMSPWLSCPGPCLLSENEKKMNSAGSNPQVLEVLLLLQRGRVCADDCEETTGQKVRN